MLFWIIAHNDVRREVTNFAMVSHKYGEDILSRNYNEISVLVNLERNHTNNKDVKKINLNALYLQQWQRLCCQLLRAIPLSIFPTVGHMQVLTYKNTPHKCI